MKEKREFLYEILKARDPRYDGRLFVGVLSTGIYCRTVCNAKLPKAENCVYFRTAAEAEKAGFRPCLQCRPELAPGFAPVDATSSLARKAAELIESGCGSDESISKIAEKLGCTDRHLRRAFEMEYHVSPVQYRQTCRLLLAKTLLTDSELSVTEVAMASGFGSLRRFNELFRKRYRLTPTALRRSVAKDGERKAVGVTLGLGYRPPYQWDRLLKFLSYRAIPGVEIVRDGVYYRTARLSVKDGRELTGWIKVGNNDDKDRLKVTISDSLLPVLPQVLSRIRRQFDLYCEPSVVQEKLISMDDIKPGLFVPGTRIPGCFDMFEMSVRAVLGQQITVKAATTLAGRFVEKFGIQTETGIEGLDFVFPSAEQILSLGDRTEGELSALGIISSRARTICSLAELIASRETGFELWADPEAEMTRLVEIPGIGPWTAGYIAMRAFGWTDAFLETDLGVKKGLAPRSRKEMLELAESWRPWRAYAVMCIWNASE